MVFFDVGGTLVSERADPATEITAVLRRLGLPSAGEAARAALDALGHAYRVGVYAPATAEGERAFWRALAATCLDRLPGGAAPGSVEVLADALEGYPAWYAPQPGMADLLRALRAHGRPLGVISNWPPSLPRLLDYHALGPFRVIACSGTLRTAKPDPAIFRWALTQAGLTPAAACYIGNEPALDYRPAEALGMWPILWDPQARHVGSGLRRAGSAKELGRLLQTGA